MIFIIVTKYCSSYIHKGTTHTSDLDHYYHRLRAHKLSDRTLHIRKGVSHVPKRRRRQ